DPAEAELSAVCQLVPVERKEVRKADKAEPKISEAQPRMNAAAPDAAFAEMPSTRATNTISRIARRSCASQSRQPPALPFSGPKDQAGQVRVRRNQPHRSFVVCRAAHSVKAWLPKTSTRISDAITPAPVGDRALPRRAMAEAYGSPWCRGRS